MSCQRFGSRLRGPERLEPELAGIVLPDQRRKHRGRLRTHLVAVPCSVERLARQADQIRDDDQRHALDAATSRRADHAQEANDGA
jgi:hypothetical protein